MLPNLIQLKCIYSLFLVDYNNPDLGQVWSTYQRPDLSNFWGFFRATLSLKFTVSYKQVQVCVSSCV